MTAFSIGIDTGGTYTDAVIIDRQSQAVVATSKALTTRARLEIGVSNALNAVIEAAGEGFAAGQIALVSLSTTLATNALVEGMGSSVATVLIGFNDDMVKRSNLAEAIPGARIIRVEGGHDYDGRQTCPLDETGLKEAIERVKDSVDAYAVAANYSIRNPEHEQRAKAIIQRLSAKPVTASTELSDGLNGPRRALTATFNVRIVPLIIDLVESVRLSMRTHGIDAPLMIVKGDGSIASAESVIEKPIETILSGPAASVIGANFISNLSDFIISDVGGTTTDVAIVRNGWPRLNPNGAMAGGFRTLVRAIDMQTIGLGGDSEVEIDYKGRVGLRANRVTPISLIGHRFPPIVDALKNSLRAGMGLARALRFIFVPEGFSLEKLPAGLTDKDLEFIDQLLDGPRSFDEIVVRASDRARAERLLDRGLVQVSAITPSDAAHVLGLQSQWSSEAARLGCLMLGRSYGLISWDEEKTDADLQHFASAIFDEMVGKSTALLVNQLGGHPFSKDDPLVNSVTHGNNQLNDLSISLKPAIPVVAVGGPAPVFYPRVGERLKTDCLIPPHAEVTNAIGAAIGQIKIRTVIEITSNEAGGYHLHHDSKPLFVVDPTEALEQARQLASARVEQKALSMGGSSPEIEVQVERVDLPNMDKSRSLIAATVTAECLSSPPG